MNCLMPSSHLSIQTYLLYVKSGLNLTVSELVNAAKCFACLQGIQVPVQTYLLCRILEGATAGPPSRVILQDPVGQFWKVLVDTNGLVGAESDVGPKTDDVILRDATGAFWKMVVNSDGLIGAESNAGPATLAPEISDGSGTIWTIIVDTNGTIGASS